MPASDKLPVNLKAAREKSSLSQREVALRLGVSKSAVSQWESGTVRPTPENIASLARLYRLPDGALEYSDLSPAVPLEMVREISLPTFDRTPYYRHRLSPAAYERLYGYLERLRNAGYDEEHLETAERIMTDPRYAAFRTRGVTRGIPPESETLTHIDAAWGLVCTLAALDGVAIPAAMPEGPQFEHEHEHEQGEEHPLTTTQGHPPVQSHSPLIRAEDVHRSEPARKRGSK